MNDESSRSTQVATPGTPQEARKEAPDRLTSMGLFKGRREIEIEHAGRIYRLRITQNDKLILTA